MNSDDAATQAPDVLGTATMDTGGSGGVGCADDTTMEDDGNQYQKQQRMIEEIADQVKQQQTLTSTPLPISTLRQQYVNNPNFIIGIELLEKSYSHLRTIRGDGNCYYRAFLYSLLETLIQQQQQQQQQQKQPASDTSTTSSSIESEGQRLVQYVTHESFEQILQQNYDETAVEIFHDEMIELFRNVVEKRIYGANGDHSHESTSATASTTTTTTTATFHDLLNVENSVSDYCTWYLRLVTATYMKQDPDRFLPFVLSANHHDHDAMITDIQQFCSKYIEPMGQECEHVQVLALAEAFQIHVTVVYLDGRHLSSNSDNRNLQHHHFGPDTSPIRLTLLYRPGHYDILYKK